jgi:hypothetical protein
MRFLRNPKIVLALGILTRILTFFYLGPNNNDLHIGFIQFLVEHKRLPLNTELMLGFHPPLYYLLAAPLYEMTMRPKVVQLLSLAFSLGTLIVIYNIVYRTDLIAGARARLYSFWLACFLPQFVMFGLYISNDTLTTFLGSLLVLQSWRYIQSGGWKPAMLLAVITGLGLLTKATFLAFLPIVFVLVLFRELRAGRSALRAASMGIAFLALTAGLGGYKLVDNYLRYRNPFMNSLDVPRNWSIQQQTTYRGPRSFVDVNMLRLLASPHRSATTVSSYPLVLYGTFWYQHIPESNFRASQKRPFYYLGPLIYLVALVPTGLFLIGLAALMRPLPAFISRFSPQVSEDRRMLSVYVAIALVLSNFALVLATLIQYHVWALAQGRYLFPSLAGGLAAFGVGVEMVGRSKIAAAVVKTCMVSLVGLFTLYLASEIGYMIATGS